MKSRRLISYGVNSGMGTVKIVAPVKLSMLEQVSLELSDREKFCDIFRILGRSFGPNFGFPYMFCTFRLLPQLKIGRNQPA